MMVGKPHTRRVLRLMKRECHEPDGHGTINPPLSANPTTPLRPALLRRLDPLKDFLDNSQVAGLLIER